MYEPWRALLISHYVGDFKYLAFKSNSKLFLSLRLLDSKKMAYAWCITFPQHSKTSLKKNPGPRPKP